MKLIQRLEQQSYSNLQEIPSLRQSTESEHYKKGREAFQTANFKVTPAELIKEVKGN